MRTSEGGGGGGSSTFSGLDDVSFSNLEDGQIAKYNSTEEKWENKENSLANLSDVSMLTLSDKQVLSYNGRTQKWENKSNSVSRLSDVSLNSPSDGDILRYNAQSGEWENAVMPDAYHAYSTSEQIVGEWIDGKPLYERTFKFANNVNFDNGKTFDTNISNMDFGFVEKAIFFDYGQSRYETVPFWQTINTSQTPSSYMQIGVQSNTGKIVLRTNTSWSANNNRYLIVTLRYTKTTD
jgi:hypothetical protein